MLLAQLIFINFCVNFLTFKLTSVIEPTVSGKKRVKTRWLDKMLKVVK